MGRKVGEVILRNKETWQEERWTVEEILSAMHHAIQDAMLHYEERFPTEPFFLKGFRIGDGTSVKDFAPIIASLEARKSHAEHVLSQYRKEGLPLGLVAKALSVSIADLMDQISADSVTPGTLFAEWADRDGQEESRKAALNATEVVITRSALHTGFTLSILNLLASSYKIVAPQSLQVELRDEVAVAERLMKEGQRFLARTDSGITAQDLEPGDPYLVERHRRLLALQAWLEKNARLETRPLESVQPRESREEEARDTIGRSSYDAMALVRYRGYSIHVDDLGLRRFLPLEHRIRSFSTVGALRALTERGALVEDDRDKHLLAVLQRRYITIPASRQLIEYAIRHSSAVPHSLLVDAFGLVRGVSLAPLDAARIIAQTIKGVVTSSVQMMPGDEVAEMGLEAMALRWPRALSAQALTIAASEQLALLPTHLTVVQRACVAFVKPRTGLAGS